MASMQNSPALRAAATTSRAWRAFNVKAFSTRIGLPAASASNACSWCWACVVAI
jgi:hypothetical protein